MMLPILVIYLKHVDKEISLGYGEYLVLVMQTEDSVMSENSVLFNPCHAELISGKI